MTDLLQTATTWLAGVRKAHAGSPVLYRRGAEQVTVTATRGRTPYTVTNEFGFTITAESQDFILSAADLALGGTPVLPALGDEIRVAVGESTEVYEVMDLAGQGCWRWSDPHRTTLRIHAKHTATE